jgi:hypothetical protein
VWNADAGELCRTEDQISWEIAANTKSSNMPLPPLLRYMVQTLVTVASSSNNNIPMDASGACCTLLVFCSTASLMTTACCRGTNHPSPSPIVPEKNGTG